MKLKSNRFAVIPVMCSHCKRYVWMEPYRSGETWNKFIDRFVKIRLCNEGGLGFNDVMDYMGVNYK